ncbi:MAG: hypothetical protein DRP84_01935 [Spirochaetes bacterium]|nr:MAG: hypothetical protein DRP84_01935 [Spirochaetota bacterium]
MNELFYMIILPICAGIFLWLIPEKARYVKSVIALIITALSFYFSIIFFTKGNLTYNAIKITAFNNQTILDFFVFRSDNLSRTISLFIGFFGFMFSMYSILYIGKNYRDIKHYYSNFLFTIAFSFAAVLSDNLLSFVAFWGILGYTLYRMIGTSDERSSAAAKKSFILIGASDSVMIFGIAIVWIITHRVMISELSIKTSGALPVLAYICLLIAALAKAGAFPLHTWIPDYTENAPASSSAIFPASLDKLLGIYLLARISIDMFVLNKWLNLTLLIIGSITIIVGVLMAMIQHNFKRLLGFHAVSQVGYMVTGLGLGTPIGIAGGLFHMFNNAMYKSGLFLTAGSVEKRTGKSDFEYVGGLASVMPVTFISALVFSFSISGIPPFNGFASKWLIYQAIIDFGKGSGPANSVWPVWLIFAIFGSALTLASFIKFISGIYLGRKKPSLGSIKEVNVLMWLPQVLISIGCIGFGIFATNIIIPEFIKPLSGSFQYTGIWKANLVTGLIIVSIVLGLIIYLIGNLKNVRTASAFIGGEDVEESLDYKVTDFYKTISEAKVFNVFYKKAERGRFDIYDNSKGVILKLNKVFSVCHSGLLPLYTLWVIAGMLILMWILLL